MIAEVVCCSVCVCVCACVGVYTKWRAKETTTKLTWIPMNIIERRGTKGLYY